MQYLNFLNENRELARTLRNPEVGFGEAVLSSLVDLQPEELGISYTLSRWRFTKGVYIVPQAVAEAGGVEGVRTRIQMGRLRGLTEPAIYVQLPWPEAHGFFLHPLRGGGVGHTLPLCCYRAG